MSGKVQGEKLMLERHKNRKLGLREFKEVEVD